MGFHILVFNHLEYILVLRYNSHTIKFTLWNRFLSLVWGQDLILFFFLWITNYLAPFIDSLSFPTEVHYHLNNRLNLIIIKIFPWLYSWALCSIPLVLFSLPTPILHCLINYRFRKWPLIFGRVHFSQVVFHESFLGCSWPLALS